MEISIHKYELHLKHTFGISRESYDTQDSLIVSLSSGDYTGYGESTSNPYYGVTLDLMTKEIDNLREFLASYEYKEPLSFYKTLLDQNLHAFTRCALDLASHDLYGKILGKPLYEIWGTTMEKYPLTNFTIGLDAIPKMVEKIREKPWPIYKIKLGTENDLDIMKALREHTNAVFRIDANCAWTAEKTIQISADLKELGVEFIEQPLPADDWEGMQEVFSNSALPIIADESCQVPQDVEKCHGYFHGINIKLTKCGGLTPALQMIKKARELGLKVMVGCMTESTVGISAIAQLLPQLDFVDMDGALLLSEDIAEGVKIRDDATVVFPKTGGSGIKLIA